MWVRKLNKKMVVAVLFFFHQKVLIRSHNWSWSCMSTRLKSLVTRKPDEILESDSLDRWKQAEPVFEWWRGEKNTWWRYGTALWFKVSCVKHGGGNVKGWPYVKHERQPWHSSCRLWKKVVACLGKKMFTCFTHCMWYFLWKVKCSCRTDFVEHDKKMLLWDWLSWVLQMWLGTQ